MKRLPLEIGFRITRGEGFQITFENGWTVSVQFGYGNYCSRKSFLSLANFCERKYLHEVNTECSDAEVAVIDPQNNLVPMREFGGDTVCGHYTPDMVYKLMTKVRKMK